MSEPTRPNNGHNIEHDERLDAFLDNLLPEQEAQSIREQAETDLPLKQQIDSQQRIDASLKRLAGHDPAAMERALAALEQAEHEESAVPAATAGRIGRPAWIRYAGVAAALLLAASAGWYYLLGPGSTPPSRYDQPQVVDLAHVMKRNELIGFVPDWKCESDQQFRDTFEEKIGYAVSMKPLPADREMLGLSYLARGKGEGVYFLGKSRGADVIVFLDAPELIEHYRLDPPPGMNLYRGKVGKVEVYELSPLDEPSFIPYFTTEPQVWPSADEPAEN